MSPVQLSHMQCHLSPYSFPFLLILHFFLLFKWVQLCFPQTGEPMNTPISSRLSTGTGAAATPSPLGKLQSSHAASMLQKLIAEGGNAVAFSEDIPSQPRAETLHGVAACQMDDVVYDNWLSRFLSPYPKKIFHECKNPSQWMNMKETVINDKLLAYLNTGSWLSMEKHNMKLIVAVWRAITHTSVNTSEYMKY